MPSIEELKQAIAALSLDGGAELVIIFAPSPSSRKRLARCVPIDAQLGTDLIARCEASLTHVLSVHQRPFDANANPTPEEVQLVTNDQIDVNADLFTVLGQADHEEVVGASSPVLEHAKLYAVAFGAGDDRFYFVRRSVRVLSAGPGNLVTRWGGDRLIMLETPILTLSDGFDALIHPLGVVLIRQNVFEHVFQTREEVVRQATASVASFTSKITLDPLSRDVVMRACTSYAFLRKRLVSTVGRASFDGLNATKLRAISDALGLPREVFFDGDAVRVTRENVADFVRFVNRELYKNPIDGVLLSADGYSEFSG